LKAQSPPPATAGQFFGALGAKKPITAVASSGFDETKHREHFPYAELREIQGHAFFPARK
jgi:hypothetical protein